MGEEDPQSKIKPISVNFLIDLPDELGSGQGISFD
jgi:hypothetical protein